MVHCQLVVHNKHATWGWHPGGASRAHGTSLFHPHADPRVLLAPRPPPPARLPHRRDLRDQGSSPAESDGQAAGREWGARVAAPKRVGFFARRLPHWPRPSRTPQGAQRPTQCAPETQATGRHNPGACRACAPRRGQTPWPSPNCFATAPQGLCPGHSSCFQPPLLLRGRTHPCPWLLTW